MKLKAKDGIRSVSVGGKEYTADKKGFVNIPDEFVPAVLDAGFVHSEGDDAAPTGNDSASGGNDTVAGSDTTTGAVGDDTVAGGEQLA